MRSERNAMTTRLAIQLIGLYKRWVSPALPVSCRFVPTCSEYAMEACDRHGLLRGAALALWRIARCNPLGGSGYDPVPVRTAVEATEASAGTRAEPFILLQAGSPGNGECHDGLRRQPHCCSIPN